jgi:alpha-L-rhamnosidase
MGDAALTVNEALYNFDLIKFYLNFLNLIADIQLPDGSISDTVPVTFGGYPSDPNWGTALPTITWQLYRHYNDVEILRDHYSSVRAYVEAIRAGYEKTGLAKLAFHYGDWVPPPPQPMTNVYLIASFAFLHDVSLLINISQIIGFTNDTQSYTTFYQQLAEEFHREFFTSSAGYYADGMQAAQILALALPNVVPANVRDAVFQHLIQDIYAKGNHSTTGIVSTAQLFPLLSDNGQHNLAVELVSSTTYPSYGYMFTNPYENATTMWELWDAPFEGPAMNSRNHHMFSSIGAWFYSHLAGIDFQSDLILIRPRMVSENKKHLLSKINCQLSTLYGLVQVSYTRDERDTFANSILLRVSIPTNAKAQVVFEPLFPAARCLTLTEGNKVIWSIGNENKNVFHDPQTGLMSVQIGSGEYEYQALWG